MTNCFKQIVTIVLVMVCFDSFVNAQTDDSWLSYLKSVRNQFYLKDTIVFTFKPTNGNETPNYLNVLNDTDCQKFFHSDLDYCGAHYDKYFYSYYLSKNNIATLTFYSFGKYTPVLTLYNYSPSGKLLKRVEVKSCFIDAGLADSTTTHFKNDSIFVVRRWDGYEAMENNKSIMVDSITKTNFIIKSNGQIVEGTHNNEKRIK